MDHTKCPMKPTRHVTNARKSVNCVESSSHCVQRKLVLLFINPFHNNLRKTFTVNGFQFADTEH